MNTVEVFDNFVTTIDRYIYLNYDDYSILHEFIRVYIKLFQNNDCLIKCIDKLYSIFYDKLLLPEIYHDINYLLSLYVHHTDSYRYSIFTKLYLLTHNLEYIYNVIRYYEPYFAKLFISECITNNIILKKHIVELFSILIDDNYNLMDFKKIDK
jgi:hypothetical protein